MGDSHTRVELHDTSPVSLTTPVAVDLLEYSLGTELPLRDSKIPW
jgi:hypothetical protein